MKKKTVLSILAWGFGLAGFAQSEDVVVMTINGKPVTKGEFEYAYNKNGNIEGAVEKKSVAEYTQMFVNYKLKVAAAEAAHLDTASGFKKEFERYRDMQLTPHLIDTAFIDSVARASYRRTKDQLGGKDMLRLSHILLMVPQHAGDQKVQQVQSKIDSLYTLLRGGADFATLAKKYSQDPGSAIQGGALPWIGPGMTLKEFEDAAYTLHNAGDISTPVKSSVGFHIIRLEERKSLAPYDSLKNEIYAALKKQGIEEASAEHRLTQLVSHSGGRLTREAVMDSVLNAEIQKNPDLKYLVQEYHDGLLLYEISKQEVWNLAARDTTGLERTFKDNKRKYAWTEPRFKGYVIMSKTENGLKAAVKILKKADKSDWRARLKQEVNKDSLVVRVTGPYLVKKGENTSVDYFVFKDGKKPERKEFPYMGVSGKKLKQPKAYTDVKSLVESDLQSELENAWVESLRRQIPFTINEAVLKTIKSN